MQTSEVPVNKSKLFRAGQCPVCEYDKTKAIYPIDKAFVSSLSGIDISDLPVSVARCEACGHQFIRPVPQPLFLKAFYGAYMSEAKKGFYKERAQEEIPVSFRRRYGRWLERVRYLGGRDSLLDVGTGLGMFLRLAREYGFEVAGVEPNDEAAEVLQKRYGIQVHACLIEELDTLAKYDMVTMWDLLEHLPDPQKVVRKAHKMLNPGGLLVLEIPARDSFIHWLVKSAYRVSAGRISRPLLLVYGIHHLQYFSEKSIRSFLSANGFEVIEVCRDETEVQTLIRPQGRSRLSYAKATLYNTFVRGSFLLARLLKKQNKLIVFAQKK